MRKKELIAQLAERDAHIARLEQRVQTMDGLIEGYHSRESAIVSALTHAHETAATVVAEAEARARRILDDAESAAEETRKQAQSDADTLLAEARTHSAQMLSQAEATVSEYETTIAAYNAALEQAAAEAAANAERFAAFSRGRKIQPTDLTEEVAGLHELPFAQPLDLPDPSDSPAQLMQNIYRIQNRVPPEPDEAAQPSVPPEPECAPESGQEPESAPACTAEPEPVETPAEPEADPQECAPPLPYGGEAAEEPVPTVDGVLPGSKTSQQDASLDELLEEIIRAGEQYNG